jgi:D-aminoacyl-tRNA deacylase
MKAFLQRVSVHTAIRCQEDLASELYEDAFLGVGFVVLLGWLKSDEEREDLAEAEKWIVSKIQGLRVFPDEDGKMNWNLETYIEKSGVEGGVLWVPQFTLAGSLDSGFRPSFKDAMEPKLARMRYQMLKKNIEAIDKPYKQIFGRFGSNMELSFTNWGPVSFMLER